MRANLSLLMVAPVLGDNSWYDCDREVVDQAAKEGFLEYVILNCIEVNEETAVNMIGSKVKGPQECLADWITAHPDSRIPPRGFCRDDFQYLVTSISSYGADFAKISSPCTYDASTETLTITDECGDYMVDDLYQFATWAGWYIGGRQCTQATVQSLASDDIYTSIVSTVAAHPEDSVDGWILDPTSSFFTAISSSEGLCLSCYHNAYRMMSNQAAENVDEFPKICADPSSPECMHSTAVSEALAVFGRCSGFDMVSGSHHKGGVVASGLVVAVIALGIALL